MLLSLFPHIVVLICLSYHLCSAHHLIQLSCCAVSFSSPFFPQKIQIQSPSTPSSTSSIKTLPPLPSSDLAFWPCLYLQNISFLEFPRAIGWGSCLTRQSSSLARSQNNGKLISRVKRYVFTSLINSCPALCHFPSARWKVPNRSSADDKASPVRLCIFTWLETRLGDALLSPYQLATMPGKYFSHLLP
jgi:hypothetical protein